MLQRVPMLNFFVLQLFSENVLLLKQNKNSNQFEFFFHFGNKNLMLQVRKHEKTCMSQLLE